MSSFTTNHKFSLNTHDFRYVPATDPDGPKIEIVKISSGAVVKSHDLSVGPLGLQIADSELHLGTADHGEDGKIIDMDFSQNPATSNFQVDLNIRNQRPGGLGLADIRDASRINYHYFFLKVEPINLRFDSATGFLEAEIRDLELIVAGQDVWYELNPA